MAYTEGVCIGLEVLKIFNLENFQFRKFSI